MSNSKSFIDILTKYRKISFSEKDKGERFERLMKVYLLSYPNYQYKFINSLVDYSADGGGNINMRVNGIRKKLHTAESPTEFSVDDMILKSDDWDKLDNLFREILI